MECAVATIVLLNSIMECAFAIIVRPHSIVEFTSAIIVSPNSIVEFAFANSQKTSTVPVPLSIQGVGTEVNILSDKTVE